MDRKTIAVCETCGSSDLWVDATAYWSITEQKWELISTYDQTHCDNCDGETHYKMIPLEG